jgi:hypothetical protein
MLMMNSKQWKGLVTLCIPGLVAALAMPALAQTDAKEKAPMYCYVGLWAIPRAQWADMVKADEADQPALQKAMAAGTLIGFGSDVNLVHQPDGSTHDDWWCANSMAGVLNMLDQFYSNGSAASPVLQSATKHWDDILVSRHYNWHAGTVKGGYSHGSMYKLKADAPNDAVDTLANSAIVPLMEKMLANGTISEYEIDTEAIHTAAPGTFFVFYLTPNADGIDKMNAALRDNLKSNSLIAPAFDSVVDFTGHRDYLDRTTATYK